MSLNPAEREASLRTVRQYQSAVAELREEPEPRAARYTIHVLAVMAILLVLVLTFGRTDRIVLSKGKLVTVQTESVVQSLDPAIIKTIDVREGDHVAKGQLLATLDPTFAAAAVDQLRSQVDQYTAQIARDRAEIDGAPFVAPAGDDPELDRFVRGQRDLYDQQLAQYRAQINSFDQKIELAKATIAKNQDDLQRLKQRQDIAQQIEAMRSTLEQHGTGSLLNRLLASDTFVEAQRQTDLDQNSIVESQHNLASLQADRDAAKQQFLATASQELAQAQGNLATARAQLDAAIRHKELVRIVAAEDSYVLSLAKVSVGSVLQPSETLMRLMPASASVVAEIAIASRDVAFLRIGDPVTIKIDAFNVSEHGFVDGKVLWISDDIFTADAAAGATTTGSTSQAPESKSDDAYYKARVSIDEIKLINVPANVRLIPGMSLEADVKVGRRSLGAYIFGTLLHGVGSAMREP